MTRILIALALAVTLSCFEFGWRVELPSLPGLQPQIAPVEASGGGGDTECVLWADIKPWAVTRCEDWNTGEICMIASSGMMQCKLE